VAKEKKSKVNSENAEAAYKLINKIYGDGTIMKMGDKPIKKVPVISTGCIKLNRALGVGGLPKSRIIELYGAPQTGKTTVALHVIANAQNKGLKCAFIDAEHALDMQLAKNLGVNVENLAISQPDYGEQALEIVDILVRSNDFGVIVVDSVAALVPEDELNGVMGDSLPGLQARMMSQACRKLTGVIGKTGTIVIFINQIRQQIMNAYGNPNVTTGGNALKFYASVRLEVRSKGKIEKDGVQIGHNLIIKVVKNKLAPPFTQAETDLIFGYGFDKMAELLDLGIECGIFEKRGGHHYALDGEEEEKIGTSRQKTIEFLKDKDNLDKMRGWYKRIDAETKEDEVVVEQQVNPEDVFDDYDFDDGNEEFSDEESDD